MILFYTQINNSIISNFKQSNNINVTTSKLIQPTTLTYINGVDCTKGDYIVALSKTIDTTTSTYTFDKYSTSSEYNTLFVDYLTSLGIFDKSVITQNNSSLNDVACNTELAMNIYSSSNQTTFSQNRIDLLNTLYNITGTLLKNNNVSSVSNFEFSLLNYIFSYPDNKFTVDEAVTIAMKKYNITADQNTSTVISSFAYTFETDEMNFDNSFRYIELINNSKSILVLSSELQSTPKSYSYSNPNILKLLLLIFVILISFGYIYKRIFSSKIRKSSNKVKNINNDKT